MKKFFKKKSVWVIILAFFILLGAYASLFSYDRRDAKLVWGVSFDPVYSRYLGLDPKAVFSTVLQNWNFRHIRIPIHWNEVEKEPGNFDFAIFDWLMAEAERKGARVILAIGQKTPRWPECHRPNWSLSLKPIEYRVTLLKYIGAAVNRYKNSPALEVWQVENEPFFPFGLCPTFSPSELAEELRLVKRFDPLHPTLVTDSGELSTWRKTARAGDLFGTTMYRVVWNKYLGYMSYDWLPPALYPFKLWLNGRPISQVYGVELQAEPWIPGRDFFSVSLAEQYKSMDLKRLKINLDYAAKTGLPRSYLWGAEWWYWLKQKGINEIPDYIKQLPKQQSGR